MNTSFETILIANRGEIAARIIKTAQARGYRTVAVYSAPDAGAPHVALADVAVALGGVTSAESYLDIEKILDACARSGAEAVHPGYGFLSERAAFAQALEDAGLVFIGPPAAAIEAMGSKAEAKRRMEAAGVPCVPGYHGDAQDDAALIEAAASVGFPLMVKAAAGGGGRGMRLVHDPSALPDALRAARAEATSAFGDGRLLLERAIARPRHVEVQVFADAHGHAVHLFERDCSVQRRHQKVIEEAPGPGITMALRERMGAAAVAAAQAIGYIGAGTVEFLLGADGQFYFLEMNTRLQVEHPVTEAITGQDLVAWQLDVAAGHPLPLTQADLAISGHAIEARLYAEDPHQSFLPQAGTLHTWAPPRDLPGVRVDAGLHDDPTRAQHISPHYDPMIAKIIAHGATRDEARRRLIRALERTAALGATTNRAFLIGCLRQQAFITGDVSTAFIADHPALTQPPDLSTRPDLIAAAAAILAAARAASTATSTQPSLTGWSNTRHTPSLYRLEIGDTTFDVLARRDGPAHTLITVDDHPPVRATVLSRDGHRWRLDLDGLQRTVLATWHDPALSLQLDGLDLRVEDILRRPVRIAEGADGRILAPMTGKLLAVEVTPGQTVQPGQRLAILEAMKMEHNITSPIAGTVEEVPFAPGQQVDARALLVRIV